MLQYRFNKKKKKKYKIHSNVIFMTLSNDINTKTIMQFNDYKI